MKTDLSIRLAFRSIRTGKFIIFRLLSEMDSGIALATIHSAVALIPPGTHSSFQRAKLPLDTEYSDM
jgi:hypothetical protein